MTDIHLEDPNVNPLCSYWKDTSRFWKLMRKLGYKGHRGSVYKKGILSSLMGSSIGKHEWLCCPKCGMAHYVEDECNSYDT